MRTKEGVVTSAKMTGTVTVTVHRSRMHPLYKKSFRVSKKFLADTAEVKPSIGDLVEIAECRPLSKLKRFKVTKIIKEAPKVSELIEEAEVSSIVESKSSNKQS